jgi:NAD(P)-dependent dehydrogenase (short-subunit alcohol dehydrogenase family)
VGSRNVTRGEDAIAKLLSTKTNEQTTFSAIQIDINSHDSIVAAYAKIEKDYGHLDILINNAAIAGGAGSGEADGREGWSSVFETNVIGTVDMTHTFYPLLAKSKDGKIIVISSSMGSISIAEAAPPHPLTKNASAYRASKAAINMVTVEWAKNLQGVKVWGVDPGLCATEFAGEYSRTKGRDPREGADIARQCIEGEREDCVGKVVWDQDGTGVRPW